MARPSPTIAQRRRDEIIGKWLNKDSRDYGYFDAAEQSKGLFWAQGHLYRQRFDQLDTRYLLEIACGKGRHAAQVVDRCEGLWLVDTSVDAIEVVRQRFADHSHVSVHLSEDGETLPFIPDKALTAVFSYDAMVHFEPLTIASYLGEIARVLRPGGRALLHHSNYSANPAGRFTDNPGWRNYMTLDLMTYLVSRTDMVVLSMDKIDWSAPGSDALTLIEKPN